MNRSSCVCRSKSALLSMLTHMGTVPGASACAATPPLEESTRRRVSAICSLFPGERLRSATVTLSHIAFAATRLETARDVWEQLGFAHEDTEVIEHEQVRVALLRSGDLSIELLEPLNEQCSLMRFLERRGPGLHHIALGVSDIDTTFAALCAGGTPMAGERVQAGAKGRPYFFLHPSAAEGTLVEIVQEQAMVRA